MVLTCSSGEELEGSFAGGAQCWAGGEVGEGRAGRNQLPGAPPRSHHGADGSYYDAVKVIDFWDQDISQFETQFKKKIDVSHSAVFG